MTTNSGTTNAKLAPVTDEFDGLVRVADGITVAKGDLPSGGVESLFAKEPDKSFPVQEKKSVPTFKTKPRKKTTKRKKKPAAKVSAAGVGTGAGAAPEPEPKPFEYFDKQLLKIIAGMIPFAALASLFQNDKFLLTEPEKNYLAKYWDDVFMKYLPEVLAQYGEETVLIGAIGFLVVQKSGFLDVLPVEKAEKSSGIDFKKVVEGG